MKMIKRIIQAILTLILLPTLFTPFALASERTIYGNGVGGIYIDIEALPYNDNWNPKYGNPYGTGGCTWFAEARTIQLTGINCSGLIYGVDQWWNTIYQRYGFTRSSTLNMQYKCLACWSRPHIAVVEGFTPTGGIIISEGGVNGYGVDSSNGYCRIAIIESETALRNINTGFLGYIVLPVKADGSSSPIAPAVTVSTFGYEADVTWNDVGASSYYIYVQNNATGNIPYGNNIGKSCYSHFELAEGNYTVYVTAVYSSELMKTGYAGFTCTKYQASVNGGAESHHAVGEAVSLSVNAGSFDTCKLYVYRSPFGSDGVPLYDQAYLYWCDFLNSPQRTLCFQDSGYYSCAFGLTKGSYSVESGWIGWFVDSLKASTDKGPDAAYESGERVTLSVNASAYDYCKLKIIRTPTGGETYTYFEDVINKSCITMSFNEEGYYACCYIISSGQTVTESLWIGWSIISSSSDTLILPALLTDIEEEAFADIGADIIEIPDGCISIESRAFADNEGLERIIIPSSVIYISPDAFENCPNVTIVSSRGSWAILFAQSFGFPYEIAN